MATILTSSRDFLYRRRNAFIVVGSLVGGTYMLANYALSKLSDMQRRMVEQRRDKDNLQRRFAQNQEDCLYTILALLPTLGDQLNSYMDVEGLTVRLQKGKSKHITPPLSAESPVRGVTAVSEPIPIDQQANESTNANGFPIPENAEQQGGMEEAWRAVADNKNGSSGQVTELPATSEVENLTTAPQSDNVNAAISAKQDISGLDAVSMPAPHPISREARLTPSPVPSLPRKEEPASIVPSNGVTASEAPESISNPDLKATQAIDSALSEKREKLELWNELKLAAISKTVTSLYAVVLLSLQTHVQLNLLGRYAYLTSVSSLSSVDDQAHHRIRIERGDGTLFDEDDDRSSLVDEGRSGAGVLADGIDVQTERLYLTLSWWFLHRGWKQLADIVQDAVKDVFQDVALKANLNHGEFFSLLKRVRRRVEYQTNFGMHDGPSLGFDVRSENSATTAATSMYSRSKRRDFSDILFPPANHEVQVLIDAGAISPSTPNSVDCLKTLSPLLPSLLDETRDIVESDDFWRTFRLGMLQIFEVFEDSLRPSFGLGPRRQTDGSTEQETFVMSNQKGKELPPPIVIEDIGKSVRLASLFPAIARQSAAAITGVPNEYVARTCDVKELRALCAIIYSSWS